MDGELEYRWKRNLPPFNGMTVFCLDIDMSLSLLRTVLISITDELQKKYPDSKLYRLDCWHEHDGFILDANETSWNKLREVLSSEETLASSYAGDAYVRTAWFPEKREFYFRYDFGDWDFGEEADCGFDFTGNAELVKDIQLALKNAKLGDYSVEPAKSFFDSHYGG